MVIPYITPALTSFIDIVVAFLPNLVGAFLLLIIGWIIGMIVGKISREILKRSTVDKYIPKFKVSDIFPVMFEWAVYLLFIWSGVRVLGIEALSEAMQAIVIGFLPGLVKAVLIIMAGYIIAEYVRGVILKSKIVYSDIMSGFMFWIVIYIVATVALPLVGIGTEVLSNILLIVIGSLGLGLAIAIGLGLKDTIAAIAKKYQKKLK